MSLQSIVGDSRGGLDGFFGRVGASFEQGLSRIGSEILPNWVGTQLTDQKVDQLIDTTFQPQYAPPRINQQPLQSAGVEPSGFQKIADFQLFKMGDFSVTGGQALVMGLVLMGIVWVLKRA